MLRLLLTLSICLSSAIIANADPLTLTAGSFSTFRTSAAWSNQGTASGLNFSFTGGSGFDCGAFGNCGDPSTSGFLSSLFRANANGGTFIIDGVTHNAVVITFGFNDTTITGTINVFADRNVPPGTPPLFSLDFVGQGFVTVTTNPTFGSTLTRFTVVATPEPASLLLIALGVSGLAVKLKSLRKPKTPPDV